MSRSGLHEIDWSEVVLDLRRVQAGGAFRQAPVSPRMRGQFFRGQQCGKQYREVQYRNTAG